MFYGETRGSGNVRYIRETAHMTVATLSVNENKERERTRVKKVDDLRFSIKSYIQNCYFMSYDAC